MKRTLFLFALLVVFGCGGAGGDDGDGAGALPVPEDAVPEQEPNDLAAAALDLGDLAVARAVTGTVDRTAVRDGLADGDRDLVRFVAPTCGRLVARLDHAPDADYDLALFDAAGVRLATSRAALAVEHLLAWVDAGTPYLLEVGGYGGRAGDYVLRLELDGACAADAVTPAASQAVAVGHMARIRSFHAAAPLPDGDALVAGGTNNPSGATAAILGADGTTERFDAGTSTFVAGPALTNARFGPTATALPTGRVLVAGGDLGGTADLFDPWAGQVFTAQGIHLVPGMRSLHTATLLPDGRVLLAGGTRVKLTPAPVAEHLATTEVYDPKTRSFTAGPTLAHVRTSHAAVGMPDGRVLVIGGVGRSDSEWVDIRGASSSVAPGPALTTVRDDHHATLLADGRVLVTGGQDGSGRSLDTAEILDAPADPSFRLLAGRMASRRADHQAVRLPSGQVLVLGGEDDPGDGSGDVILQTVDVFEPGSETFTALPPLAVGRDDHRAIRLLDGRVLVTGGENATSTASIDACEAYDAR